MSIIIPFIANVSDSEEKAWFNALSQELPEVNIIDADKLRDYSGHTVAIVANPDPGKMAAMPDLVWVQSLWAGVEGLLQEPALKTVGIARLIDPQLAQTMAEAVLAWSLYLHRDMPQYKIQQGLRIWQELPYVMPADRRIGIMGLGQLGQEAARTMAAHKFNVLGWSRNKKSIENVRCFQGKGGLLKMVSQCDILVCLLPLTDATRNLVDAELLAQLPTGASLINFGRGAVVNNNALLAALDGKALKHAVLDVFNQEPLLPDSPLWAHEAVTILPHISAPTTVTTAAKIAAANIQDYVKNGTLPKLVDRKRGY